MTEDKNCGILSMQKDRRKGLKCQEVTGTCKNKPTFRVTTKYGAGSGDFDVFFMCKKCATNMKKECEDWGYIFLSTPMKKEKGKQ